VRIGPTNRVADDEIISELRRALLHQANDETPLADLSEDDIDTEAVRADFREVRALKSKDFENLGLLVRHHRALVPTIGGFLMYGRERSRKFPDAWIQAGVFAGRDHSDVIDSTEILSYIPRAISEVLAFVKRNMARAMHIGEVRRVNAYEIPLTAIREAVVNAIVHADYSQRGAPIRIALYVDRLEIENPGLLPFGMTVEEIQLGVSRIRNRVIARVCKELGLIEQWGSGIQRMNALCRSTNLKPPHYEEISTPFRVTLSKELVAERREPRSELDPIKRMILEILRKSGPQSTQAISERIGRSTRTVRHHLRELSNLRLVEERGSGPRDPHKVYILKSL
jgi:ATP-dependent DNA helicase RecG